MTVQVLDQDGNILDTYINEDKDLMLTALMERHGPLFYIKELYGSQFTNAELAFVDKVLNQTDRWFVTNEVMLNYRRMIDEHGLNKLSYALEMTSINHCDQPFFIVHPTNPYFEKRFTFEEALDFINERPGIYYAMDDRGRRHYDFIDIPTKKQAKYQRSKHGNQIVFLSFMDWKIHHVSESELD